MFGYLGPNGAGKTTTIGLLAGCIYPTSGTITILGGNPGTPETKRRLGYMPENPYFYDYLTVREYLDIMGRFFSPNPRVRRERVDALLERLKLAPHPKKKVRQLSKGMTHRLGMAQALLGQPGLLILDERW